MHSNFPFDIIDFHAISACLSTGIPVHGNTHMSGHALKFTERNGVSSIASELGLLRKSDGQLR
jgi:hypothetical protein